MMKLLGILLVALFATSAYAGKEEDDGSVKIATKVLKSVLKKKAEKEGEEAATVSGATIFAPTDKALKKLAKILGLEDVGGLVSEDAKEAAYEVLAYHVVPDALVYAADVPEEGVNVTTKLGEELKAKSKDGKVVLTGAGKKSYAKVLKADIDWEGNVVHVISSVLLPEGYDAYEEYYESLKTTEVAQKFWKATNASDLVSNATIFTPIDLAFKKLAKSLGLDSVKDLLKSEELSDISLKVFKYHVVPGMLYAADIPEGETTLTTYADKTITVKKKDGKVAVYSDDGESKAWVMETDIAFGDNVAHIVSDLLVPEEWQ